MMNTVLDMLGTKGIICISAGNEGDLKIALKKTFAEGDTLVKTMIYPYGYQYDPSKPESFTARQVRSRYIPTTTRLSSFRP